MSGGGLPIPHGRATFELDRRSGLNCGLGLPSPEGRRSCPRRRWSSSSNERHGWRRRPLKTRPSRSERAYNLGTQVPRSYRATHEAASSQQTALTSDSSAMHRAGCGWWLRGCFGKVWRACRGHRVGPRCFVAGPSSVRWAARGPSPSSPIAADRDPLRRARRIRGSDP